MAEREYYDESPAGSGGDIGEASWLSDPNATPPAAPPGFKYVFAGNRWQLVSTTAPPPPGGTGTSLAALTREQRDALARGTLGNMEGFMSRESYGSDVKARTTVKNMFATIASRYPSKPSSIDQILADPDFKRLFPNAKKAGFDKIDFGGVKSDFETGTPVGIIDVLTAADPNTDTARGWWWGYDAGGTGPTTYRPESGAGQQGATRPSLPSYDSSRFDTEALKKTPEERGWFTLAELGFTGAGADETPEDIRARNAAMSQQAIDDVMQGDPGGDYWREYHAQRAQELKYDPVALAAKRRQQDITNLKRAGQFVTLASMFGGTALGGAAKATSAPRSSLGGFTFKFG